MATVCLNDEAVCELVDRVQLYWRQEGIPNPGYAACYDTHQKVIGLRNAYRNILYSLVPRFSGSCGCDLGCWLGLSSLLQWSLGASEVYGCDTNLKHINVARAWNTATDVAPGLEFFPIERSALPLQSRSLDWVVTNHVLCNAAPDSFWTSIEEARRVLRSDGVLIVADGNNPWCPDAMARLEEAHRQAEVGDDREEGYNRRNRRDELLRRCPALDPEAAERLARETCYMWGDALSAAAEHYLTTGQTPGSIFRPTIERAPCNPLNGYALGNVTDPFAMARELERLGFRTHIAVEPSPIPRGTANLHKVLAVSQGFYVIGYPA